MTETMLSPFAQGCLTCALWACTDDNGDPLDRNHIVEDIAPEDLALMAEVCDRFQRDNAALLDGIPESQAGHDFLLTRNGHGSGFWDRGLGEAGDKLTAATEALGECDLYVGDDGRLHIQ